MNVQPFVEGRASLHGMVIWEDKCQTSNFLCLSPSFHSWAYQHRVGTALWLAWVICPGCVSSQLLVHCQPTEKGRVRKRKGFETGKTLFSKAKMCYQQWFGHRSKTMFSRLLWKLTSSQAGPVQRFISFSSNSVGSAANAIKHCWYVPYTNSTKVFSHLCSHWSLCSQESAFLIPRSFKSRETKSLSLLTSSWMRTCLSVPIFCFQNILVTLPSCLPKHS